LEELTYKTNYNYNMWVMK